MLLLSLSSSHTLLTGEGVENDAEKQLHVYDVHDKEYADIQEISNVESSSEVEFVPVSRSQKDVSH